MVIPYRDPRVSLMRKKKVEISAVSGQALSIVVEGENNALWCWDTANTVAIAVISITSIFVNVITKVENIVDRVLAGWIAKGVEEAEC